MTGGHFAQKKHAKAAPIFDRLFQEPPSSHRRLRVGSLLGGDMLCYGGG